MSAEFYNRIKETVKKQNTTIEWLCEQINMPIGSYHSARRIGASPKLDILIKMSKALNVSLDYLAYGQEKDYTAQHEQLKQELQQKLEDAKTIASKL